jgi:hypothetical protein
VINATVNEVLRLNLFFQHPEIIISEDYYFYQNLTVLQNDNENISVYLNKSDSSNFVKFVNQTAGGAYYQDDYTLYLQPHAYKNVTLRLYVLPNQGFNGGAYDIPFYALSLKDYNTTNTTTLKIHVNDTNPIDDIEITGINPSSLYSDESLAADISIHKLYPPGMTDVQICYCINENPAYSCGPSYNNYGCSWIAITTWLNYTKTVTVNEEPGSYYFIVAVKYPTDENIKRANSPSFYVITPPSVPSGGEPLGFFATAELPHPQLTIISPGYFEASPGEKIKFDAEVRNTGEVYAPNTTLTIYGIPENWVSVTPRMHDIGAGKAENYSVLITVPDTAFEQIYSPSLVAKSGSAEATKILILTVARSLKDQARLLLAEAQSKKGELELIIKRMKDFEMGTSVPEKDLAIVNGILDEAVVLYESADYKPSIEKAKQAIDGYKSAINSAKATIEKIYLLLLNQVAAEVIRLEPLTEEKNVINTVNEKINQSMFFYRTERVIDAYQTLLDAKQLLDQLKGKMQLQELIKYILAISILVILIVVASAVVFYKKKVSRLMRTVKIEEYKKNLRSLFRREVRPGIPERYYKEKPKERLEEVKENIERVRGFLAIGEALVDTDIEGAKDAYIKAKEIYTSLSYEEKRLAGEEIIRLNRMYNNIKRRKPR